MTPGQDERIVVVGGGVAGLVVALDLARAGLRPIVLEAAERCGGVLSAHRVGGLLLDAGAESFATARPAFGDLLTELGLADRVRVPNPAGAWVRYVGGAAPLPATSFLGIPGRPWAADVRRVIGIPGALRCGWDAVRPARSGVAPEVSLGDLVRSRLGRRVLDRLVEPVAGGVYAADPRTLEIGTVAPGLLPALVDTGSLAGAVRRLRSGGQQSGSAVATVTGGLHTVVEPLVDAIRAAGGEVRTGDRVERLTRRGSSWLVHRKDSAPLAATRVVLALPAPEASQLVDAAVPAAGSAVLHHPINRVLIVTLVVDDGRLDAAPRGTGVLVAAGVRGVQAKALTHATAKWPWLAELTGPGRHVLRLSYGRGDGSDVPAENDIADVALADARDLLGVDIDAGSVVDQDLVRWPSALPAPRPGHADAVQRLRAELEDSGLLLVGAPVAGSGLAAVVTDARVQAARLVERRRNVSGLAPSFPPANSGPALP